MDQDLFYKIALTKIPKIGPILTRKLIHHFQTPRFVFEASSKELQHIQGISIQLTKLITSKNTFAEAEQELKYLEKNDIKCIFYQDHDYPERLKHNHDSPAILYTKGNFNLDHPRNVAIVGTRKYSPIGKHNTENLVEGLKKFDVQIISGLAYGIDFLAHSKSVEQGIPTIGVLGHGLSTIYPKAHRNLAEAMLENGGLLTEFAFETRINKDQFPMRNRIVAGLCDALVVVESGVKGGSIITAEFATNYNKDVFAIPGRIQDKVAGGCNRLIKINKAHLLEKPEDIAYIMGWDKQGKSIAQQQSLFVDLSEKDQKIIESIKKYGESSFDKLSYETEIQNSELAGLLLNLEFQGIIKSLPGKRFILD